MPVYVKCYRCGATDVPVHYFGRGGYSWKCQHCDAEWSSLHDEEE